MESAEIFSVSEKTLFGILARNLFGAPFSVPVDTDWRRVIDESVAQAVFPLTFKDPKALPLNGELWTEIEEKSKKYSITNVRCFQQHGLLHTLMTEQGIEYSVIKGLASAHYYPEPLLRGMGDVDFYVEKKDIDRAAKILVDNGFERIDKNHACHVVMKKQNMHFEMHFDMVGIPDGEVGEIIRNYLTDVCREARPCFDEFVSYSAPSPFHHGLIMLLHLQHHLLAEGVGLRHLCDWAVFVNSFSSNEFVQLFEERLKKVGLWRFACLLSLAAADHVGLSYKSWMGDDHETSTELMRDIVCGGNFGRKDGQRYYEGKFISDRGKDGVGKGRLRQVFKSLNQTVRRHWMIAAKIPLVYPFGWIYFSVRYLILAAMGKRASVDLIDTYKKGGSRKKLYGKFKLYIPEEKTEDERR